MGSGSHSAIRVISGSHPPGWGQSVSGHRSNVEMDDNPVWSPDGSYIAFASNRTGNWDIFIVPADGGRTQRLTWHTGADAFRAIGRPDGKYIIERVAVRDAPYNGLYAIDVATGATKQLMLDMMPIGSPHYSMNGKTVLYSRFGFPWVRPRYHGSAAAQMWKLDLATGKRTVVQSTGFQHLWPTFGPNGNAYAVTATGVTRSSSSTINTIPKIAGSDDAEKTPNIYEFSSKAH